MPKEILVIDRLPLTAIGKVHKQTLKLDITRRVAEAVVRQSAGDGNSAAPETRVEPDSLHGIVVHVRVPKTHADAVSSALAAFTFHTDISTTEEDKTDA